MISIPTTSIDRQVEVFNKHYTNIIATLEAAAGGTGLNPGGEEDKIFLDSSLLPDGDWGDAIRTPEVQKVFSLRQQGLTPGSEEVIEARDTVIRGVSGVDIFNEAMSSVRNVTEDEISHKTRVKQIESLRFGFDAVCDSLHWAKRGIRPQTDFGSDIMPGVMCDPKIIYHPAAEREQEMKETRQAVQEQLSFFFNKTAPFPELMERYNTDLGLDDVGSVYREMIGTFLKVAKERLPWVPEDAKITIEELPQDSTQMGSFDYRGNFRGHSRIRPDPETPLARIYGTTKHEFTHFLQNVLEEVLYRNQLQQGINDSLIAIGTMCTYMVTADEGTGDHFDGLFGKPFGLGPELWEIPPQTIAIEDGLNSLRRMYVSDCSLRMFTENPQFGDAEELRSYIMDIVGIESWANSRSKACFDPSKLHKAVLYHPLYHMNKYLAGEIIAKYGPESVIEAFSRFPVGITTLEDACQSISSR